MTNPNQGVQAILHEIVRDLEKTSAGLIYISEEFHKLVPSSIVSQIDALELTSQAHKGFYDKLRAKIDALQITSQIDSKNL
jgi:hypothetical protein